MGQINPRQLYVGRARPEFYKYVLDPLDGQRQFLTGLVEQVQADVQKLARWGATEVFFSLRSNLPSVEAAFQGMLEQMRLLCGVREE